MNAARIAQLLRELAAEIEGALVASPPPAPKAARTVKPKAPPRRYQPRQAPTDLDVARARAAGRKAGILPS